MDIETLRTEITTDPLGIGYSTMSDAQVATSINSEVRPTYQSIPGDVLLTWAAEGANDGPPTPTPSRIIRISLAAQKLAPFDSITYQAQGYAAAAVSAIQAQLSLSYGKAEIRTMIGVLKTAGILSSQEVAELTTLGTTTVSRANELGLPFVKTGHIEQARI